MSGMADEEFEWHVRFAREYMERLSMEEIMERATRFWEEWAKWTAARARGLTDKEFAQYACSVQEQPKGPGPRIATLKHPNGKSTVRVALGGWRHKAFAQLGWQVITTESPLLAEEIVEAWNECVHAWRARGKGVQLPAADREVLVIAGLALPGEVAAGGAL